MATYPGGIPSLTNPTSTDPLSLPAHATQHANANDEIEAICTELGTNPKAAYGDVSARLDAMTALIGAQHTQNTDVGTSSSTFYVGGLTGPLLKDNSGDLQLRDAGDANYADLLLQDINVQGNVTNGVQSVTVVQLNQAVLDDHTHANKALLDTYTQTEANLSSAVSLKHTQNTDTGTTNETFQMNNGNVLSAKIKVDDLTPLYVDVRNAADDDFADIRAANFWGALQANNADLNRPTIRYNESSNYWEYSNDGVIFSTLQGDHDAVTVADTATVNLTLTGQQISADVILGGVDHNSLLNYDANEHIDHSTLTISTGVGLTGGGHIAANRTFELSFMGLENLVDPNANRILGWDDPAGAFEWFIIGTGLNYDPVTNTLISTGGAGGNTLDAAYDQGGAGVGRTISADTGAVEITVPDGANNAALILNGNDATNDPDVLRINHAANGVGLYLNQSAGLVNGTSHLLYGYSQATSGTPFYILSRGNGNNLGGIFVIQHTTDNLSSANVATFHVIDSASLFTQGWVGWFEATDASNTGGILRLTQAATASHGGVLKMENAASSIIRTVEMNGSIGIVEQAAAPSTDTATIGQIWVKNDTPCALMFTDDTGTDWNLLTGGGTLDDAYDSGGAGAGRTITADSGAVEINQSNTAAALNLTIGGVLAGGAYACRLYSSAAQVNAGLMLIQMDNVASDQAAFRVTNTGTGNGIQVNAGAGNGIYADASGLLTSAKHAIHAYSNAAQVNADAALVKIHHDNASATEPALEVITDGSTGFVTNKLDSNTLIVSPQSAYATISAAMAAANAGDTILVAEGTYDELVNFSQDFITLKAIGSAKNTTITYSIGTNAQIVLMDTAGCVLDGFTIAAVNATDSTSPAISVDNADATHYTYIQNCIINVSDNPGTQAIRGINVFDGNVKVINNTINMTQDNDQGIYAIVEESTYTDTAYYINNTLVLDNNTTITNPTHAFITFGTSYILGNTVVSDLAALTNGANYGVTVYGGTAYIYNNSFTLTTPNTGLSKGLFIQNATMYAFGNVINATTGDSDGMWIQVVSTGTAYVGNNTNLGDGQSIIEGNYYESSIGDTKVKYVAPAGGNAGGAYHDIKEAMDNAVAGDTILIAPGSYVVYPKCVFTADNITVKSASGNPKDTIVTNYASPGYTIFDFSTYEGCRIEGLTLRFLGISNWTTDRLIEGANDTTNNTPDYVTNCILDASDINNHHYLTDFTDGVYEFRDVLFTDSKNTTGYASYGLVLDCASAAVTVSCWNCKWDQREAGNSTQPVQNLVVTSAGTNAGTINLYNCDLYGEHAGTAITNTANANINGAFGTLNSYNTHMEFLNTTTGKANCLYTAGAGPTFNTYNNVLKATVTTDADGTPASIVSGSFWNSYGDTYLGDLVWTPMAGTMKSNVYIRNNTASVIPLNIVQNADYPALNLDASTGVSAQDVLNFQVAALTTGRAIDIASLSSLTSGNAMRIVCSSLASASLIYVDNNNASSTGQCIKIENAGTGYTIWGENTNTGGAAAAFGDTQSTIDTVLIYSNGTKAGTEHVVHISSGAAQTNANAAVVYINAQGSTTTEPALEISNAGNTAIGIQVNMSGTSACAGMDITMNSASGGASGYSLSMNALTTGTGISATGFNALTTGQVAYFISNSASHTTQTAYIIQDNASATAVALKVKQDAVQPAIETEGGSLSMLEMASAPADTANYGQIWVKSDTPNTLYFTDDAGTDWPIGGAAAGGGGWEYVSSVSWSAETSKTFSSLSNTYRYRVVFSWLAGASNVIPQLRFNSDSGTNYSWSWNISDSNWTDSSGQTSIYLSRNTNPSLDAGARGMWWVEFEQYPGTNEVYVNGRGYFTANDTAQKKSIINGGWYGGSGTLSSVTVFGDNTITGTAYLYRISLT